MTLGPRFWVMFDQALSRSRADGERAIALARLVLASLLLVRVFLFEHHDGLTPRIGVIVGIFVLNSMMSFVVLRKVTRDTGRHTVIIGVSALFDGVLAWLALIALALWPYEGYRGLASSPSFAFLIVAVLASALRFSLPLLLACLVLNATALASLLSYELLGPHHHQVPVTELATAVILFVSTATLSTAMVVRARKMMVDGALALLSAERAADHLGAYVSTDAATRALAGGELSLGGARQSVTVLFSDLRGFTSYSETLPPEQLVSEINAYFTAMVEAVTGEGGVVDKFIGDAVMVVFGVPETKPDDAWRAIRGARAMQRALARHNLDRHDRGLPPLVQGIGVHTGPAVVGNIGTRVRMQHTVMGSVVNLASRLEEATKHEGVAVLISAATVEAATASGQPVPKVRKLPPLAIRGLREPLGVYCFPDDGFSTELRSDPPA